MSLLNDAILTAALKHLAGKTYDSSARPADGTQDCTRATYAILRDVIGPDIERWHDAMHIRDASQPFSNVRALIDMGYAVEVDPSGPLPVGWMLMQGWVSLNPLKRGHAWLWRSTPYVFVDTDGLIVQATNSGNWCEERAWFEQRIRFPHVQIAALKQS